MKILILAICMAAPLLSQSRLSPLSFPSPWQKIVDFLSLSSTQLAEMGTTTSSFAVQSGNLDRSDEHLRAEIELQTRRSDIRPLELGPLHVSLENNRRERRKLEATRAEELRKLLSESQLARFRLLEELVAIRPILNNATQFGLFPTDCSTQLQANIEAVCSTPWFPLIYGSPAWASRTDDFRWNPKGEGTYYPRLLSYLGLSPDQQVQIVENEPKLTSFRPDRMKNLVIEIRSELAKPNLDVIGIGYRFAELELLRREQSQAEREFITSRQALLNPQQRLRLSALRDAARLRDTVTDARSLYLLENRCASRGVIFAGQDTEFSFPGFFLLSYYTGECPDERSIDEQP